MANYGCYCCWKTIAKISLIGIDSNYSVAILDNTSHINLFDCSAKSCIGCYFAAVISSKNPINNTVIVMFSWNSDYFVDYCGRNYHWQQANFIVVVAWSFSIHNTKTGEVILCLTY